MHQSVKRPFPKPAGILRILFAAAFLACGSTPDQLAGTLPNLSVETFVTGPDTPWAIAIRKGSPGNLVPEDSTPRNTAPVVFRAAAGKN